MDKTKGKLHLIVGEMRGGKTELFIRHIKRLTYAKRKIQIFKPVIDNRFDEGYVVSRNGDKLKSIVISDIRDVMHHLSVDTEVVGIEEFHLFDDTYMKNVVNALLGLGIDVIMAGLDMDYLGEPFSITGYLMCRAEVVEKVHAVCTHCGDDAWVSHRISDSDERIQVGDEIYEPLCRTCFAKELEKLNEKA